MALPPILVELRASSTELMAKLGEAQAEIAHLNTQGSANMSKMAAFSKAALAGVGAAVIAVGTASVELADKFEASRARLEGAVANVGGSFDAMKGHLSQVDSQMQHFGYTNTETESALAGLVTATKSPTQALNLMGLAADIARGRNMDLASASQLLVKVETGHVSLLGRLGIATKDAAGNTITQEQAVQRLTQLYGGDASRYAETFTGKVQALKAASENLGARLGMVLVPALTDVLDVMNTIGGGVAGVVHWFEQHKVAAAALAVVLEGALVPAEIAAVTAFARMIALNAAAMLITARAAVMGLATAFVEAGGGAEGLSAGLAALNINPLVAGLTALAAVTTIVFLHAKEGADQAKASVKDFVDTLAINPNDTSSLTAGLDAMKTRIAELQAASNNVSTGHKIERWLFDYHGMDANQTALKQLQAAYRSTEAQGRAAQATAVQLGEAFHMTTPQVVALADANGIDLSKGLQAVVPKFAELISSAKATHAPLQTAAAAFGNLGQQGQTAAQDIQSLNQGLDTLLGNFLSTKQAEQAFHDDLKTLIVDLRKSKGSLNENTAAGDAARAQYLTTAGAINTVVQAVYKQTGSLSATHAALEGMLGAFAKTPAGGHLVTQTLQHIRATAEGMTGVMHSDGTSIGSALMSGITVGIQAGAGKVNFITKSVIDGVVHTARVTASVRSPSRRFAEIGMAMDDGLIVGLHAHSPQVMRAARDVVEAAIAAAVQPQVTDTNVLASLFGHAQSGAINRQADASIAKAHYRDMQDLANEAAKALRHLTNEQANAAGSASKSATALHNEATNALQAAAAMASHTKAEQAAKAAAEAHAHALERKATLASQSSAKVKAAFDSEVKAAQRNAEETAKAAAKAKASYDKMAQAAQNAAQRATQAAQDLVAGIQSQVDALQSTIQGFEQSISQGLTGDFSLSSIWQSLGGNDENGNPITPTVGGLQTSLDSVLAGAQQFAADLKTLAGEGASQSLIQQIAGMGPEQGDALAQQLITAGQAAVGHLSDTYDQIGQFATGAAGQLAAGFYGGGVSAMESFIKGLMDSYPDLRKALRPILSDLRGLFGGQSAPSLTYSPAAAGGTVAVPRPVGGATPAPRGASTVVIQVGGDALGSVVVDWVNQKARTTGPLILSAAVK